MKNIKNEFYFISKWWINQANKKIKLEAIEEVNEPDNVNSANVEKKFLESEADKFLVLFEIVFKKKHIEEENITVCLDAEDGAFQDILEKIANKISKKIKLLLAKTNQ